MGEGNRGEVEARAEEIADSGFAFDGQTGGLQMRDVAVNGAGADLEPPRHVFGAGNPVGAQVLHQSEQSFGATNLKAPFRVSRPPD